LKLEFNFLAVHSGSIYFIHAGVLTVVAFLKDYLLKMDFDPLWYILVVSIFVCVSSLLFSILLSNTFKKIRKKTLIFYISLKNT